MIEYGVESISWRSSLTSRVHRALGREPVLDLSENSSACDTREIDRLGISQGSTFNYPTGPFGRAEKVRSSEYWNGHCSMRCYSTV